jgi:signal transduction histidine kinase
MITTPETILLICLFFTGLIACGSGIYRLNRDNQLAHRLKVFLTGSYMLAGLFYIGILLSVFPSWIPGLQPTNHPVFLSMLFVLFAGLFVDVTHSYINGSITKTFSWIPFGIAFLTFLTAFILPGLSTLPSFANQSIFTTLTSLFLWVGWGIANLLTYQILLRIHQQQERPLHRNRIYHWLVLTMLLTLCGAIVLAGWFAIGALLFLPVLFLLAYLVHTHPLPDIQKNRRRALRYGLFSFSFMVYFVGWLLISFYLIPQLEPPSSFLAAVGMLILVSISIKPVSRWISRATTALVPEMTFDIQVSLREFSARISKLNDFERLAQLLLEEINHRLEIQNGYLMSVESDVTSPRKIYQLRCRSSLDGTPLAPITLAADEPLLLSLNKTNRLLSLYEIDYLPEFKETTGRVKNWLVEANTELCLPISSQNDLVGLVIIGPKVSRAPFTRLEMDYLQNLGEQAAFALENARLVSGLTRLNSEYRRAYTALEISNQKLETAILQLEKIDRVKSDFITILSHELRTPMTLISGYAQLLLDEPELQNNPHWEDLLKGIASGAHRLEEIITEMLDMAAIDSQSLEITVAPVDLASLLTGLCQELGELAAERHITLTHTINHNLPRLETDEKLLTKALRQVFSNAIKYSPDDSEIKVSTRRLPRESSPIGEDAVIIQVQDQGIGIDQVQTELIFKRLYQTGDPALHSSGKIKFKGGGPGLGLAIARGILNELHGLVWAESRGYDEVNFPGSTFWIVLPITRSTRSTSDPALKNTVPLSTAELSVAEEGDTPDAA